jgi:hypothetical protein
MKIISFTVIHPKIPSPFRKIIKILRKNISICDFLILNDNKLTSYQKKILSEFKNVYLIEKSKTPNRNRAIGLNECIKLNYDYIINFDLDDEPENFFFKKVVKKIQNSNQKLFYTNLILNKKSFVIKKKIKLIDIIKFNYLGYGCSVMHKSVAKNFIKFSRYNIISLDWFFILHYLNSNKFVLCERSIKIKYNKTKYNFLAKNKVFSKKNIKDTVLIKINLYKNIIKYLKLKNKIFNIVKKEIETLNLILTKVHKVKSILEKKKNLIFRWNELDINYKDLKK